MNSSLVYYGHGRLRASCEPIEKITEETHLLVEAMIRIIREKNGIGLAAPQAGQAVRLFVSAFHPDKMEVFINPTLMNPSHELETMQEGCLSMPGLYHEIARPQSIMVSAMDLEGKWFMKQVFGLEARVIMHENDLLNGVFFTDLLSLDAEGKKKLERELAKIERKYVS